MDFFLMTSISALHNLNRSLGCALLIAASGKTAFLFVRGELILYLVYKIARRDYFCFYQIEGVLAIAVCFWQRVCVKVVADFRYEAFFAATTRKWSKTYQSCLS